MRPIRVRFSMGTLLLVVAVAAVNFWALSVMSWNYFYRHPDFIVGALPLANVAVVGTLLFAVGRFRRARGGGMSAGRTSVPALAFFSLQFLLIGGLFTVYMPSEMQLLESWTDSVLDGAAELWPERFGKPESTVAWAVVSSVILCVMVSGPLLMIAWAGHALANRLASRIPRRRFLAMAGLVSTGFAAGGLAICFTPRPFREEVSIRVDVQVIDSKSGRPIPSADVRIKSAFWRAENVPVAQGRTGPDGRVQLVETFEARGEQNAFQTIGVFSTWGSWLEVSSAEFQTRRIPLPEVVNPTIDLDKSPSGKVELTRGETPEDSFRDVAGDYATTRNSYTGSGFKIEPDGRFAFRSWSCTHRSGDYGFLKRVGDEFELIPVPNPGETDKSGATRRYRLIEWGDCRYFSDTEAASLEEFCRAALIPGSMREPGEAYGGFLRDDDIKKMPRGFPRLKPTAWARFLLDEFDLDNKENLVTQAVRWGVREMSDENSQLREFDRLARKLGLGD